MSISIMSAVWKYAPYEAGTLLVLLALADWCDDAGQCFPSIHAIAQKARLGARQVANILKQLAADGVISIDRGGGRGRFNHYRINCETLASVSVKPSASMQSVSMKSATETLQSTTRNTVICDNAIRKEPSEEPSLKPSVERVHRFQKPTLAEVTAYCQERGNRVNPQKWFNHYEANGWRVGRNPMKDWKAATRTWEDESNANSDKRKARPGNNGFHFDGDESRYTREADVVIRND